MIGTVKEALTQPNDPRSLLIVLGKNLPLSAPRKGKAEVQRDPFNLSTESRINAIAAGMLWKPDMDILFSTGKTAGDKFLSEAKAMADYMGDKFPHVPDSNVYLEQESRDTAGNAQEVAKWLRDHGAYERIYLLSVGYHLGRAAMIFARYGVPIEETFAAESILANTSEHHQEFVKNWRRSRRIRNERLGEGALRPLFAIDKNGALSKRFTARTRH